MQIGWVEQTRKFFVLVSPSKVTIEVNPYCSMQVITNYQYKRQSFINVTTIVQPISGHLERLYDSIVDPQISIALLARFFMSSLRM